MGVLDKEPDNKKGRDGFVESARTLELLDIAELRGLAETMFKDMPDAERHKEEEKLKEIEGKYQTYRGKIDAARSKLNIK